jgi:hypothetical protein
LKLLFISSVVVLAGCGSNPKEMRDEMVRSHSEAKLKQIMNDYDSYEFVSLTLLDSNLYSENAEELREDRRFMIGTSEATIELEKGYQSSSVLADSFNAERLKEAEDRVNAEKAAWADLDKLVLAMGSDSNKVASYTYEIVFRGKNKLGAKVLSKQYIQTGPPPAYDVLTITEDPGKLLDAPGTIPGFDKVIDKHFKDL